MTEIESLFQLACLIYNEPLKRSDAIIDLQGDGLCRTKYSAFLFKKNWAPLVIVSGGVNNKKIGIPPPSDHKKELIKNKVPKEKIILETNSQNTHEQAKEAMKIVRQRKWKKIILVASHFHQIRAYLTFLKAMEDANLKIQIINAPVRDISWFEKSPWGKSRFELLGEEWEKIREYGKRGHLAETRKAIFALRS